MSDTVKVTIQNWGYKDYKPGDVADVTPEEARRLLHDGNGTPANKTAEKALDPNTP